MPTDPIVQQSSATLTAGVWDTVTINLGAAASVTKWYRVHYSNVTLGSSGFVSGPAGDEGIWKKINPGESTFATPVQVTRKQPDGDVDSGWVAFQEPDGAYPTMDDPPVPTVGTLHTAWYSGLARPMVQLFTSKSYLWDGEPAGVTVTAKLTRVATADVTTEIRITGSNQGQYINCSAGAMTFNITIPAGQLETTFQLTPIFSHSNIAERFIQVYCDAYNESIELPLYHVQVVLLNNTYSVYEGGTVYIAMEFPVKYPFEVVIPCHAYKDLGASTPGWSFSVPASVSTPAGADARPIPFTALIERNDMPMGDRTARMTIDNPTDRYFTETTNINPLIYFQTREARATWNISSSDNPAWTTPNQNQYAQLNVTLDSKQPVTISLNMEFSKLARLVNITGDSESTTHTVTFPVNTKTLYSFIDGYYSDTPGELWKTVTITATSMTYTLPENLPYMEVTRPANTLSYINSNLRVYLSPSNEADPEPRTLTTLRRGQEFTITVRHQASVATDPVNLDIPVYYELGACLNPVPDGPDRVVAIPANTNSTQLVVKFEDPNHTLTGDTISYIKVTGAHYAEIDTDRDRHDILLGGFITWELSRNWATPLTSTSLIATLPSVTTSTTTIRALFSAPVSLTSLGTPVTEATITIPAGALTREIQLFAIKNTQDTAATIEYTVLITAGQVVSNQDYHFAELELTCYNYRVRLDKATDYEGAPVRPIIYPRRPFIFTVYRNPVVDDPEFPSPQIEVTLSKSGEHFAVSTLAPVIAAGDTTSYDVIIYHLDDIAGDAVAEGAIWISGATHADPDVDHIRIDFYLAPRLVELEIAASLIHIWEGQSSILTVRTVDGKPVPANVSAEIKHARVLNPYCPFEYTISRSVISIPRGLAQANARFYARDDDIFTGWRSVKVWLDNPVNCELKPANEVGIWVRDDEEAEIRISIRPEYINEVPTSRAILSFTANRTSVWCEMYPHLVLRSVDGYELAENTVDFTMSSSTPVISYGESSTSITISGKTDQVADPVEKIAFVLDGNRPFSELNNCIPVAPPYDTAVLTIFEGPVIVLLPEKASVMAGDTTYIQVLCSTPFLTSTTVRVRYSNSARRGKDYNAVLEVNFAPGESEQRIIIPTYSVPGDPINGRVIQTTVIENPAAYTVVYPPEECFITILKVVDRLIAKAILEPGIAPHPYDLMTGELAFDGDNRLFIRRSNGSICPITGGVAPSIADIPGLDELLDSKAVIGHTHSMDQVTSLTTTLQEYANLPHTHSMDEVDGVGSRLAGKVAISHAHDITAFDGLQGLMDGKSEFAHTHVVSEIVDLSARLQGFAAANHTHPISSVTGLQTALNTKSASDHTHTLADITDIGGGASFPQSPLNYPEIYPLTIPTFATIDTAYGFTAGQYVRGKLILHAPGWFLVYDEDTNELVEPVRFMWDCSLNDTAHIGYQLLAQGESLILYNTYRFYNNAVQATSTLHFFELGGDFGIGDMSKVSLGGGLSTILDHNLTPVPGDMTYPGGKLFVTGYNTGATIPFWIYDPKTGTLITNGATASYNNLAAVYANGYIHTSVVTGTTFRSIAADGSSLLNTTVSAQSPNAIVNARAIGVFDGALILLKWISGNVWVSRANLTSLGTWSCLDITSKCGTISRNHNRAYIHGRYMYIGYVQSNTVARLIRVDLSSFALSDVVVSELPAMSSSMLPWFQPFVSREYLYFLASSTGIYRVRLP